MEVHAAPETWGGRVATVTGDPRGDVTMEPFRAAVAQLSFTLYDVEANTAASVRAIEDAASKGAALAVLPELANVGYITRWSPEFAGEYYARSERLPGRFSSALVEAAQANDVHVVVGMSERSSTVDGLLYNTALLITPAGDMYVHRKIHLPREEKRYFGEGDRLEVFGTRLGNIGLLICADNSFPEAARLLALRGAQVVAIPYAAERPVNPTLYRELAAVRAYENQLFVLAANRCGQQDAVTFAGTSTIAAPNGAVLAALEDAPGIAVADLDPELLVAERLRQTRFRDRRPHLYPDIASP
jgi:predicted amidohydrolase